MKVRLMCGANTKVVTAVDMGCWAANDINYFTPLVERTAVHFDVKEVSADKAYLSRKNMRTEESVDAMAFIPLSPTPQTQPKWARGQGCPIRSMYRREAYMEHYHKRSNIEIALSRR